jgi:hypothetical protein
MPVDQPLRDPAGAPRLPRPGGLDWTKLAVVALLALVAGIAVDRITGSGNGGSIRFSTSGVEVEVPADQNFASFIREAIAADERAQLGEVEAVLASQGYYRLTGTAWVDALRNMSPDETVDRRVRELLYDLRGPFAPAERTFEGADERLISALEALMQQARAIEAEAPGVANAFLARILADNLEQRGLFAPRSFNAEVAQIAGPVTMLGSLPVVYACPGSVFLDKEISLTPDEPGRSGLVSARVVADLTRFDSCSGPPPSMQQLLANKRERFGFPAAVFAELWGPVESGATPPMRLRARVQVRPLHYSASYLSVGQ